MQRLALKITIRDRTGGGAPKIKSRLRPATITAFVAVYAIVVLSAYVHSLHVDSNSEADLMTQDVSQVMQVKIDCDGFDPDFNSPISVFVESDDSEDDVPALMREQLVFSSLDTQIVKIPDGFSKFICTPQPTSILSKSGEVWTADAVKVNDASSEVVIEYELSDIDLSDKDLAMIESESCLYSGEIDG